ncbi:YckD family protein [Peptococcaceae bacterium]|nr:YckD family protein [Peptococcaceae bacterium]
MFNIKKKLLTVTLGTALMLSTAGMAMAAITPEQATLIKDWQQQRLTERAVILQTHVDNDRITAEQMQTVLERMETRFAAREAAGFENCRAIQPDGSFQPVGKGKSQGLGLGFGNGRGQGMGPDLGDGAGQRMGQCGGFGSGMGR